jgi:serine/threonine-protein kinase
VSALFAARYERIEELGRGDFGVVFRANDTHLGREVALKLLQRGSAELAAAVTEARALTTATSPCVLGVINADTYNDVPYIVTDIAEHRSVEDHLAPFGVDGALAIRLLRHVLTGLSTCHARGLLHRDIKPSNIFLRTPVDACLGDFGVVGVMDANGRTTVDGGSVMRPPEALALGYMDVRSDIYQVGCAAYRMVTGANPFQNEEDIVANRYSRVRDSAPHIPASLARTIETALQGDPNSRFQSPAAMDAALARVRRIRPVWVRDTPPHYADERYVTTPASGNGIEVLVVHDGRSCNIDARRIGSGRHVPHGQRRVSMRQRAIALRAIFDSLSH